MQSEIKGVRSLISGAMWSRWLELAKVHSRVWILASRPKTLTATLVPIVVATALVGSSGITIKWWVSFFALLSALFIQIGTNFFNDAIDFKKGADSASRLGPSRATQKGWVTADQMLSAGVFAFALASVFGVALVLEGGLPIIVIGLVSLVMGYAYTGGPYPLAYRGLGDLFVVIFFGLVAIMGLVFLHSQAWSLEALLAGLQIGLHCAVLIAINNLRDVEGDTRANKKTLPVRFGKQFARWEIFCLIALPFLLGVFWLIFDAFWAFVLPLLALPMGVQIVRFVFANEPSEKYNSYLGKAAALHLLFGALLSVGFLL